MTLHDLPAVNASLNGLSAVFLGIGFVMIKRKNIAAHRACMVTALITSTLFLTCYLIYHLNVRVVTKFTGQGIIRPVYFTLLISHIILAVTIVPLVCMTAWRAIKQRFEDHKRIARITWPLWMYVSVTGVIIYVMLYHLYPAAPIVAG
ncbi:MAG: putative rane protein [Verrucomicrobiales bacterium]|nr:putative rane protein [Verrucomicrobiales bacterium]